MDQHAEKPPQDQTSSFCQDAKPKSLGNSFRSDGSRMGFARMSSDDFERASEDNDENNANAATIGDADHQGGEQQIKPILATAEKTKCYRNFENHQVRVEGPEFNRDFTYYLVHKSPELKDFEKGIQMSSFQNQLN